MTTKQQTSKEYFRTLQIIYYALIASQLFFGIVFIILVQGGQINPSQEDLKDIFNYIVPLFIVGGIFGSNWMFTTLIKDSKKIEYLPVKMAGYRIALIVRYAFLQAPTYFSLVVYILTGGVLFLLMAGVIVVKFLTIKPTIERAARDLDLTINDKQAINDPNRIIAELKIER